MNSLVRIFAFVRNPFIIFFSSLNTAFWATSLLVFGGILPEKFRLLVGYSWSKLILLVAGVAIEVTGRENLPAGGALYVFNHTSHFDIPVAYVAVKRWLRFGAKRELFKIPFLAMGMKRMHIIPIDRSNRRKVLESYRAVYNDVTTKNNNVMLAPEGTRQQSEKIGAFKTGPFVFAIESKCLLVPVVMCGVSDVLGKNSLIINPNHLIATVKVHILPPIDPSHFTMESLPELQKVVHEQMVSTLARLQKS